MHGAEGVRRAGPHRPEPRELVDLAHVVDAEDPRRRGDEERDLRALVGVPLLARVREHVVLVFEDRVERPERLEDAPAAAQVRVLHPLQGVLDHEEVGREPDDPDVDVTDADDLLAGRVHLGRQARLVERGEGVGGDGDAAGDAGDGDGGHGRSAGLRGTGRSRRRRRWSDRGCRSRP